MFQTVKKHLKREHLKMLIKFYKLFFKDNLIKSKKNKLRNKNRS